MNTDYTEQAWAVVFILLGFAVAKTYNDHAFVVWGEQGVALQKQQLAQEARIAEALQREVDFTVPAMTVSADGRIATTSMTALDGIEGGTRKKVKP